jgi:hypothetical protein
MYKEIIIVDDERDHIWREPKEKGNQRPISADAQYVAPI